MDFSYYPNNLCCFSLFLFSFSQFAPCCPSFPLFAHVYIFLRFAFFVAIFCLSFRNCVYFEHDVRIKLCVWFVFWFSFCVESRSKMLLLSLLLNILVPTYTHTHTHTVKSQNLISFSSTRWVCSCRICAPAECVRSLRIFPYNAWIYPAEPADNDDSLFFYSPLAHTHARTYEIDFVHHSISV